MQLTTYNGDEVGVAKISQVNMECEFIALKFLPDAQFGRFDIAVTAVFIILDVILVTVVALDGLDIATIEIGVRSTGG